MVGCGRIVERVHLDALARASGLRVTALVDPDPARLDAVSRRTPGAARYEALERLVAADTADAVVIATPPSTHTELAIEALKAGLHVYIEKPVAPDTRGARSILEAHRQTDRVAAVGFNYRLHPLVRDARRRLAEVGELRAVRTVFSTAPGADPEWKRRRQTGGGALLDLGSHHVDLVRYLTGEAFEEVWASIDARDGAEASTVALHARLTGGATAQMLFALASTDADRVELFGPRGRLHYDRHRSGAVRLEPPEVRYGRPAQLRRVVGELRAPEPGAGLGVAGLQLVVIRAVAVRGHGARPPAWRVRRHGWGTQGAAGTRPASMLRHPGAQRYKGPTGP